MCLYPYSSRSKPFSCNSAICLVAFHLLLTCNSAAMATIVGSVHDLSTRGMTKEVCNVCHTPHDANNATAPLWNHELSTSVYTLYSSDTLISKPVEISVGSPSRLCLSCHDGTVAIDSFGGMQGDSNNRLSGIASKGTDLSDDHPVSIPWNHDTMGVSYPSNNQCVNCHPGSKVKFFDIGLKKQNENEAYPPMTVECPSCHDVHNNQVADKSLLRETLAGSKLCLICHPK